MPKANKTAQVNKAPAKKTKKSNKADLTSLWGGALGYGSAFGPGAAATPMGYGAGAAAVGYPGAAGAWGYEAYGPNNYAEANLAGRDRMAAAGAARTSTWDANVAGRDQMQARAFRQASRNTN